MLLEVHCLQWPLATDAGYGHLVQVELLHKLHDELKNESLDALREGIARDTAEARRWFGLPGIWIAYALDEWVRGLVLLARWRKLPVFDRDGSGRAGGACLPRKRARFGGPPRRSAHRLRR